MKKRHQRLLWITLFLLVLGTGVGIILYAMNDYMLYFKTPKDVLALARKDYQAFVQNNEINGIRDPKMHQKFQSKKWRIGAVVKKNSVRFDPTTKTVFFIANGPNAEINIRYNGTVPSLFREGQTVVVDGYFVLGNPVDHIDHLDQHLVFHATNLLAKHDENYRPPGMEEPSN